MEDFQKIKDKIINDRSFRKETVKESLYWFGHTYLAHYILYPTATFQKDIYGYLQDWSIKFLEIIAFRGSAKSTMANLILPIWAIISGKAKFVVIIAATQEQAKQHIYNIITELEYNRILMGDWGPFEGREEWTKTGVVLPKYGVRIIAKSRGQKIRGIRHKQFRPDLIVIDDPEDLKDIRTKENRNETYKWLTGEVIPAGDRDTRYVLIGNLLHSDSLLNRIKGEIEEKKKIGVVKEYPFWNKEKEPLWKGKFKTKEDVEQEKGKHDYRTWQREFLLKMVPEAGQEVKDNWIKYYDKVPEELVNYKGTGIDLAISKKETANYTAMVSGKLAIVDGNPKIYIMPNPVNERYTFHETIEKARAVSTILGGNTLTPLWVEDVAYQKSAVQEMQRIGLPAEGIKVSTDKRARLRTVATYIQNETVMFPKTGCEDLIIQLTGFGVEAFDDLSDAFVFLVQGLMSLVVGEPMLTII